MCLKPPTASVVGRGDDHKVAPSSFWLEECEWQRSSISTDSLFTTCVSAIARTETISNGWISAPWRQRSCPTKSLDLFVTTPHEWVTRQKILSERLGRMHISEL